MLKDTDGEQAARIMLNMMASENVLKVSMFMGSPENKDALASIMFP
jgi:hypothetical protein